MFRLWILYSLGFCEGRDLSQCICEPQAPGMCPARGRGLRIVLKWVSLAGPLPTSRGPWLPFLMHDVGSGQGRLGSMSMVKGRPRWAGP